MRAGVVEVVLTVDHGTLSGEQVRQRVADGHPSTSPRVQRAGGVGRDEFEVDALRRERVTVSEAITLRHHASEHVVQPSGREVEVDESGTGDLDAGYMRRKVRFERRHDARRGLTGRDARVLRNLQGHVRGPVAVVALLRDFERDATGRLGKAGSVERAAYGVDEGFADHTTHISWGVLRRPGQLRVDGNRTGAASGVLVGIRE